LIGFSAKTDAGKLFFEIRGEVCPNYLAQQLLNWMRTEQNLVDPNGASYARLY
jgi:hypothetical protein